MYSGTNAEFTKADAVIFRGDIFDENTGRREYTFKRTIKYDSHMLDKPDFVGSYEVGDYVYFFFRETAVEYINCGKTIYSRIARVCKKDTGGKNILLQNWATFLKARLNCSIPGNYLQVQAIFPILSYLHLILIEHINREGSKLLSKSSCVARCARTLLFSFCAARTLEYRLLYSAINKSTHYRYEI